MVCCLVGACGVVATQRRKHHRPAIRAAQEKAGPQRIRPQTVLGSEANNQFCPEPSGRAMVSIAYVTDYKAP